MFSRKCWFPQYRCIARLESESRRELFNLNWACLHSFSTNRSSAVWYYEELHICACATVPLPISPICFVPTVQRDVRANPSATTATCPNAHRGQRTSSDPSTPTFHRPSRGDHRQSGLSVIWRSHNTDTVIRLGDVTSGWWRILVDGAPTASYSLLVGQIGQPDIDLLRRRRGCSCQGPG